MLILIRKDFSKQIGFVSLKTILSRRDYFLWEAEFTVRNDKGSQYQFLISLKILKIRGCNQKKFLLVQSLPKEKTLCQYT